MSIITCPTCGTKLEIDDDQMGRNVQCGSCQQVFEAKSDVGDGRSRKSKFGREDHEEERPSRRRGSRRNDDEDDDRPSRRRRNEDEDDEDDRPSRRSRRNKYRDDEDDEDDYRPKSKRPSQIQTVGVLLLIGGISAVMASLGMGLFSTGICCLWPGTYYELVYGILAIVRGSQMMGANDPPDPPKGLCIMAIICIINGDVLNLIFGIVGLTMLGTPEVIDYYTRRR